MNKTKIYVGNTYQHGASLLIVLLLLLVMTLLGLASLRSTVLEEKMASNQLDRSYSFQTAESALRTAENLVLAGGLAYPTSGACDEGLCPPYDAANDPRWVGASAFDGSQSVANNYGLDAEYIVEYVGEGQNFNGCKTMLPINPRCLSPRYRVTSRSTAAGRSTVILQSVVAAER
jgi:type IV pilus assembly protein PilX